MLTGTLDGIHMGGGETGRRVDRQAGPEVLSTRGQTDGRSVRSRVLVHTL